jgi:transposase
MAGEANHRGFGYVRKLPSKRYQGSYIGPDLARYSGLTTFATKGVRHGVTSLFAAFNIADGTVISSIHRRHRAIEFKKFLAKIDAEIPDDLDVHLVCDNYGTHKTPSINAWLARHPRFHMHFTPTSSSWINQVERWFGFITDELIRRGSHTSVQALEADIRAWAKGWNDDPKSFIWTKPAEQILESIGRLLTRSSGAGH